MHTTDQTDAFDGIFDDPQRGVRELIRDGRVAATAQRHAIPRNRIARTLGMHKPFGDYPPPPGKRPQ